MTIVDPRTKQTLSDQTPTEGRYLSIYPVNMNPTLNDKDVWFPMSAFQIITAVDHDKYRCCWENASFLRFPWIFYNKRWQALSVVDGKAKYETIEAFGGIGAYFVRLFCKSALQNAFVASMHALKERCKQTR
jgi:hypothetical protein